MNEGLALDKQQHMNPVFGLGRPGRRGPAGAARGPGCRRGTVDPAQIGGYDVVIADTQAPAVFGAKGEFFASGRLDNLSATHAGLTALIAHAAAPLPDGAPIAVLAAFDHEEIGSASRSGACGPILEDVLVRISDGLGASASQRRQAFAASFCVSADAGHAVHPNYRRAARSRQPAGPERRPAAEDQRQPALRHGRRRRRPLGAAVHRRRHPVPGIRLQQRDALRLHDRPADRHPAGIRTVDVGVPLLSMHSARELCGVEDPYRLAKVTGAVLPDGGVTAARIRVLRRSRSTRKLRITT